MNKIGTITESSLHAALKELYALPGDRLEEPVLGYFVDILRADEIVEIQTSNFTSLRPKLEKLLATHRVRIVVPVTKMRHILRIANNGSVISQRLSPKKGRVEDIFNDLVSISSFLANPNLIIEAALVSDEIRWIDDGGGSWRRKYWSIGDRNLVTFHGTHILTKHEFLKLIPPELDDKFTSRQLAHVLQLPIRLASKMLYCLRALDVVQIVGRQGKAYIYERISGNLGDQ